MPSTQTGAYIAIAGLIVTVLAHFSIIIPQDSIVAILAALVTIYGTIHQYFTTRAVVAAGRAAGAHI